MDQLLASINPDNPGDLPKLKQAHRHLVQRATELESAENELVAKVKQLEMEEKQNLSSVLEKLTGTLGLQNVSDTVQPFAGEQRELHHWFRSVEKHVALVHGSPISEECIRVAYKSSRHIVSRFIGRYLQNNKRYVWKELKAQLQTRFGEPLDAQRELAKLRKYVQRYDQGVQVFGEHILSRATEIFSQEDLDHDFIQQELILIFATGLRSKAVARKVVDKKLSTLEDAITCAVEAAQRNSRLKVHGLLASDHDDDHRDIEPMDVTEIRRTYTPPTGKGYSHQQSSRGHHGPHYGRDAYGLPTGRGHNRHHDVAPQMGHRGSPGGRGHRNEWVNNRPRCNRCFEIGHIASKCPQRSSQRDGAYGPLN